MKKTSYFSVLLFTLASSASSLSASYQQANIPADYQESIYDTLMQFLDSGELLEIAQQAYEAAEEDNEYGLTNEDFFYFTLLKLSILDKINSPADLPFPLPPDQRTFDVLKSTFLDIFPQKLKEVPQDPYPIERIGFRLPSFLMFGTWILKIFLGIGGKKLSFQLSWRRAILITIMLLVLIGAQTFYKLKSIRNRFEIAAKNTMEEIVSQQQSMAHRSPNFF